MPAESCSGSYGWLWLFIIIVVIVVLVLLWIWTVKWDCASCKNPNFGRPQQVEIFNVEVVKKDESHPNYGKGSDFGFAINGVQGKSLILKVGKKYRFDIRTKDYSFYIGTKEKGSSYGAVPGAINVTGHHIDSGSFPFIPLKDHPQPLYYCSSDGEYMGFSIIIE